MTQFHFFSSIKRERKERFFTNLERKLGVSLKDFAKQKILTQKSGNGISLEPKKIVLTEDKFEKEQVEKINNNKAIGKLIRFILIKNTQVKSRLSLLMPVKQQQLGWIIGIKVFTACVVIRTGIIFAQSYKTYRRLFRRLKVLQDWPLVDFRLEQFQLIFEPPQSMLNGFNVLRKDPKINSWLLPWLSLNPWHKRWKSFSSLWLLLSLLILEWHASFYVPSAYAKLGLSMATGDVNDDGLDDLLVWHANYFNKLERFTNEKKTFSIFKTF